MVGCARSLVANMALLQRLDLEIQEQSLEVGAETLISRFFVICYAQDVRRKLSMMKKEKGVTATPFSSPYSPSFFTQSES